MVLRGLAAAAAVTAVVGAVVMRRWDIQAGKRVAELTRARAGDEWRFDERVAELETDLDESRELRRKLEQRLRAKRAELAGLRNEHAALLRRYATAETERATALEGRRLLEIEATSPARALPPGPVREPDQQAGPERAAEAGEALAAVVGQRAVPALFSPDGSRLFLRAGAALARLDDAGTVPEGDAASADTDADADTDGDADGDGAAGADTSPQADASPQADIEAGADAEAGAKADAGGAVESGARAGGAVESGVTPGAVAPSGAAPRSDVSSETPAAGVLAAGDLATDAAEASVPRQATASGAGRPAEAEAAREDEAQGKPEAAAGQEHAAAASVDLPADPQHPAGHFTVPTAVAVVPPAPARRPAVEGGFDFFGTKAQGADSAALEAVQNEDLADVVGQEALDVHKAETEAAIEAEAEAEAEAAGPADGRAVGQVIDLTAHDETEQIDVQGLRTAAS